MMLSKTVISILLFLPFYMLSDGFQEVVNQAENDDLKKRLKAFRQNGIEKKVNKPSGTTEDIIEYAKSFLDTPHKMGGTDKNGIDCSGLVMEAFKKYGVDLPHSSNEQARFGKVIANKDALKRGDMVFFHKTYNASKLITHSGIYLGDGEFIHTSTSQGVTISDIDDPYYWGERYMFATRLF